MKTENIVTVGVLAILASFGGYVAFKPSRASASSISSSNPTAATIETFFQEKKLEVLLGNVKFNMTLKFTEDSRWKNGIENGDRLWDYVRLRDAGLIEITSPDGTEKHLMGSGFVYSKENFHKRFYSQEVEVLNVAVKATVKGEEIGKKADLNGRPVLQVQIWDKKVTEIVDDTEVKSGLNKFRVVQGRIHRKMPKWLEDVSRGPFEYTEKFKVLFKFDSFQKKWLIIVNNDGSLVADVAIEDQQFTTNNVESKL